MPAYTLRYTPEALEGISKLTGNLKEIAERVLIHIAEHPQSGKRLSGTMKGILSVRVTRRYRLLYLIKHTEKEIIVLDCKHRKESYD
jgi:mRNA-degrading endonuclease RelE of RelBE toxin-antitoxin system